MPKAFELEEFVLRWLKSQREFIFSPSPYSCIAGGWGCGKTRALCAKGILLSYAYPGNLGVIGRFNATDLQDTTMVEFFDVCPKSWIKSYNKQRKWLTLTNGSQIAFRHLSDPNPRRSHLAGMSLGWFGIDQAEECDISHWNVLCGRLRRPCAKKRFGFSAINPNGKDWNYNLFFNSPAVRQVNQYTTQYQTGDLMGLAVRSDENRKSQGGFVDDSYFDGLRQNMAPEWVARYLDCSFEDFSGKIYKEYTLDSVHNVEPFDIPRHWGSVVGIDVGGDPAPWGMPVGRIDDYGNVIWTDEFYRSTVNMGEVAGWYKEHVYRWQDPDTLNIIDPENKIAMIEFAERGIHCRPAMKAVRPGIIRVGGYVHVNAAGNLPPWYSQTQPPERVARFQKKGSPRMFVFRTCNAWRKEFDNYQWDVNHPNKPLKRDDHIADAVRYVIMARPHASDLKEPTDVKRETLRRSDPGTATFWDEYDKRVAKRMEKKQGRHALAEAFGENDGATNGEPVEAFDGFDWGEGA